MTLSYKNFFLLLLLTAIVVFFKCIPHLPNFSPQIILFIYLGSRCSKMHGLLSIFTIVVIADLAYAWISGTPIWGSWMLFVYSAYLLIGLIAAYTKVSPSHFSFVVQGLLSSLGFWLWTNLESWWFSGGYAHTYTGLLQCYTLALPFLYYSLAAALVWSLIIIGAHHLPSSTIKYV